MNVIKPTTLTTCIGLSYYLSEVDKQDLLISLADAKPWGRILRAVTHSNSPKLNKLFLTHFYLRSISKEASKWEKLTIQHGNDTSDVRCSHQREDAAVSCLSQAILWEAFTASLRNYSISCTEVTVLTTLMTGGTFYITEEEEYRTSVLGSVVFEFHWQKLRIKEWSSTSKEKVVLESLHLWGFHDHFWSWGITELWRICL